eukprot:jgi/Psemu1/55504/gm1.55504_g
MQEMFDEYAAMLTVDAAFKLSEWGMRMIQGQFPRLKDRLLLEDFGDRKVILNVMMLLYNYQTSTIGHNQILNVFMHKKNGYFSNDTEPTEDATGMFEFFRLFKPKLNGNTDSNVKSKSNVYGDSGNIMLNINNRLLRFFRLFERGVLPEPIHSI